VADGLIYLATPYSHPDAEVRESRFQLACIVAGMIMAQGGHVFSPIAHSHPIAVRCGLPKGFDYWKGFDRKMIAACSHVLVVKMDGWQESKGIAAELEIARELGKPVSYMEVPE
jgi:hypothetical protein